MSKINLDEIKKIVELFDKLNINKFRIKYKKFEIEVDKCNKQDILYNKGNLKSIKIDENSINENIEPILEEDSSIKIISSPIPGIFYRASSPDAKPFVEEGDAI